MFHGPALIFSKIKKEKITLPVLQCEGTAIFSLTRVGNSSSVRLPRDTAISVAWPPLLSENTQAVGGGGWRWVGGMRGEGGEEGRDGRGETE